MFDRLGFYSDRLGIAKLGTHRHSQADMFLCFDWIPPVLRIGVPLMQNKMHPKHW